MGQSLAMGFRRRQLLRAAYWCALPVLLVTVGTVSVQAELGRPAPEPSEEEPALVAPGEEIVGERTSDTKTYATEVPGVFRTEMFSQPVHVENDEGDLVDAVTRFTGTPGGFETEAALVPVQVGGDTSGESLAQVTLGEGLEVAFGQVRAEAEPEEPPPPPTTTTTVPGTTTSTPTTVEVPENPAPPDPGATSTTVPPSSVAPETSSSIPATTTSVPPATTLPTTTFPGVNAQPVAVDGALSENTNTVSYDGALPGVEVQLTAVPAGLKEVLLLDSPAAGSTFVFPLQTNGLTVTLNEGGTVEYRDSNDEVIAITPPGVMEDSALESDPPQGHQSGDISYELREGSAGLELVVSLDRVWLSDPERVWPVSVDPSVFTVNADSDDTHVVYASPADRSGLSTLSSGNFFVGTRAFMHFDTSARNSDFIYHADLNMWESYAPSCTASEVRAYQVTASWVGSTTTTYAGPSLGAQLDAITVAKGSSGCAADWVTFDVTTAVQNWTDSTWTNYGIGIRAADEYALGDRKQFDSANGTNVPYLSIVWAEDGERADVAEFDISVDQAGCVDDRLYGTADDAPVADMTGVVRDCVADDIFAPLYAARAADTYVGGLDPGEQDCLADQHAAMPEADREQLIAAGIDPGVADDTTSQEIIDNLYNTTTYATAACGLTPPEGP